MHLAHDKTFVQKSDDRSKLLSELDNRFSFGKEKE